MAVDRRSLRSQWAAQNGNTTLLTRTFHSLKGGCGQLTGALKTIDLLYRVAIAIKRHLIEFAERGDQGRQCLIHLLHGSGRQVGVYHHRCGEGKRFAVEETEFLRYAILVDCEIFVRESFNQLA